MFSLIPSDGAQTAKNHDPAHSSKANGEELDTEYEKSPNKTASRNTELFSTGMSPLIITRGKSPVIKYDLKRANDPESESGFEISGNVNEMSKLLVPKSGSVRSTIDQILPADSSLSNKQPSEQEQQVLSMEISQNDSMQGNSSQSVIKQVEVDDFINLRKSEIPRTLFSPESKMIEEKVIEVEDWKRKIRESLSSMPKFDMNKSKTENFDVKNVEEVKENSHAAESVKKDVYEELTQKLRVRLTMVD